MSPRPDLSVIMVTHNHADLALATLRSARAATGPLSVQWLVVDSGSTDGTADAIAAEAPDVTLLRCANIGFAAGNNRGLALARGRYVLLLNPDVEIIRGRLSELVEELDRRPDVGIASVVLRDPDHSLQYSIRRYPSPLLALGEALATPRWSPVRSWREEEVRPRRYAATRSVDWLVGAFLIARATAIDDVGWLDGRFFLYSEEIDWCYRFRQAGWDVRHMPLMDVIHHTASIASRPDLSAQLSYAKVQFAEKHYGPLSTGAIRAALALRHAMRAAGASLLRRRPEWRTRGHAERHAFRVVVGTADPPFGRTAPTSAALRSDSAG